MVIALKASCKTEVVEENTNKFELQHEVGSKRMQRSQVVGSNLRSNELISSRNILKL